MRHSLKANSIKVHRFLVNVISLCIQNFTQTILSTMLAPRAPEALTNDRTDSELATVERSITLAFATLPTIPTPMTLTDEPSWPKHLMDMALPRFVKSRIDMFWPCRKKDRRLKELAKFTKLKIDKPPPKRACERMLVLLPR